MKMHDTALFLPVFIGFFRVKSLISVLSV